MRIVAVIMAGGKGERFWPKSTASRPKQFLALWGEGTLLQQAFHRCDRLAGGPDAVFVVTGPDYVDLVREQLPDLPPDNLIVEPGARDTAPAIGYATLHVERRMPDAVMVVVPSDHVILDEDKFVSTLRRAAYVAACGDYLVTIGITPTRPEEGYGYIECGDECRAVPGNPEGDPTQTRTPPGFGDQCFNEHEAALGVAGRVFRVKRFTEKPDVGTALEFIRSGKHLWNAGMFAWRIPSIRAALERHAPSVATGLHTIEGLLGAKDSGPADPGVWASNPHSSAGEPDSDVRTTESGGTRSLSIGDSDAGPEGQHPFRDTNAFVRDAFLGLEKRSIDYAVLEKADNVLVVLADFGWDDVGTWAALERIRDRDEKGNVVQGRAVLVDSRGNIVENSSGDKMLVAFGVDNLVIVNTEDVVLVADKRKSGSLRKATETLRRSMKDVC